MRMQWRSFQFELREAEEGKLAGYAVVYNAWSETMWGFRERFLPGAFARSLSMAERDVVALWSHDHAKPLASRSAGTLDVFEDERGVGFSMTPSETSWGRDALTAIRRGDVRHMSFGFASTRESEEWEREGESVLRTVREADLYEISPVVFPAYPATSVEVRSASETLEQFLATAGAAHQAQRRDRIEYLVALNNHKRRLVTTCVKS